MLIYFLANPKDFFFCNFYLPWLELFDLPPSVPGCAVGDVSVVESALSQGVVLWTGLGLSRWIGSHWCSPGLLWSSSLPSYSFQVVQVSFGLEFNQVNSLGTASSSVVF